MLEHCPICNGSTFISSNTTTQTIISNKLIDQFSLHHYQLIKCKQLQKDNEYLNHILAVTTEDKAIFVAYTETDVAVINGTDITKIKYTESRLIAQLIRIIKDKLQ